jgi:hypothetical protein
MQIKHSQIEIIFEELLLIKQVTTEEVIICTNKTNQTRSDTSSKLAIITNMSTEKLCASEEKGSGRNM